jgi:hypothetical protein
MEPCCGQSLRQDGPVRIAPALDLRKFGDDVPVAAVEVDANGFALRFEAKARRALLRRQTRRYEMKPPLWACFGEPLRVFAMSYAFIIGR